MELHYLWVKNFGCLHHDDVNFSAKYIFNLIEYADQQPELHIWYNPDFISDFFRKPNVSNVTAIIGQNGTGKTTILEYIKHFLHRENVDRISDDIIAYTVRDSKGYVKAPLDMRLILRDKTGDFNLHEYSVLGEGAAYSAVEKVFFESCFVYYSYFLDYKNEEVSNRYFRNISTNALLVEHRNFLGNIEDVNDRYLISDLDQLMQSEVAKAIQLLVAPRKVELPFSKPDSLSIDFVGDDLKMLLEKDRLLMKLPVETLSLLKDLNRLNTSGDIKQRITNKFYISLLANFLYDEIVSAKRGIYNTKSEIIDNGSIPWLIREFFKQYYFFVEHSKQFSADEFMRLKIGAIIELIDAYENALGNAVIVPANYELNGEEFFYLKFPLSTKYEDQFQYFMRLYLRAKGNTSFLSFKWTGLSTGQQSYLSFLSRIYHIKHHEVNPPVGNVVFLIDEGDAGYHPEWQRKFFKETLDFIGDVFHDNTVQLIFTSNTPFLTSDLTNPHVIFIEKDELTKRGIIHSSDGTRSNTFGANIHELFANSFYMNGALIGQFAKDRINEVISYLKNDQLREPNMEYLKTIELIGEPILRKKLLQMWIDKFRDDEETLLLKRLEEIRRSKPNPNP